MCRRTWSAAAAVCLAASAAAPAGAEEPLRLIDEPTLEPPRLLIQSSDYDSVYAPPEPYVPNTGINEGGVEFNLDVLTPDTFTAATMASLLNAAALYKKMSGTDVEKQAIDGTKIDSSSGRLIVTYKSSDQQFATLLQSSLFQSVVR